MEAADDELFDAVVIGTGFGGAVAACRLAQAGKKLCVLERGRHYSPMSVPAPAAAAGDFPQAGGRPDHLPHTSRWMWALDHGLWDVDDLSGALAVHAAGYGGGSLVYASVHLRPPVQAFDRWPEPYKGRTELEPYYDLVAAVLRVQPLPAGSRTPKAEAMQRAAESLGRRGAFFKPPLAIDFTKCQMSGGCITGCQNGAKNTLDLNYLRAAEELADVDVRTLAEVDHIEEAPGRYTVSYRDLITGEARNVYAKSVFLCAGAVNSTRILLRSAKQGDGHDWLPNLNESRQNIGAQFFTNGDAFAMVFDTDRKQPAPTPTQGPTITTSLLYNEGVHPLSNEAGPGNARPGDWFLVQDGGYPEELRRLLGFFRGSVWLERNRVLRGDPEVVPAQGHRGARFSGAQAVAAVTGMLQVRDAFFRVGGIPGEVVLAAKKPGVLASGDPDSMLPPQVQTMLHDLEAFVTGREDKEAAAISLDTLDEVGRRLIASKPWWLQPLYSGAFKFAKEQVVRFLGPSTVAVVNERLLGAEDAQRPLDLEALWPLAVKEVEGLLFGPPPTDRAFLMLAMGLDPAPGKLSMDGTDGRLSATWDLAAAIPFSTKQERLLQDIAKALGGELRLNPDSTADKRSVTVHALGGCAMAAAAADGVVDTDGKVFGTDALYVLDGAAIPGPLGANPSATIAALAERNVRRALQNPVFGGQLLLPVPVPVPGNYATYFDPALANGHSLEQVRAQLGHTQEILDPIGAIQTFAAEPAAQPVAEPLGLRFKEVMRGTIDFVTVTGVPIRAELTATIPDLNAFLVDPNREVNIKGEVFFPSTPDGPDEKYQATGTLELLKRVEKWDALEDLFKQGQSHFNARSSIRTRIAFTSNQLLAVTMTDRPVLELEHESLKATLSDTDARIEALLRQLESQPRLYEMQYRLQLVGPASYRLEGQKRISDGPGIAAWQDTTTMKILLSGPHGLEPLGTGTMNVHMADLLGTQVPSFEILGADGDDVRIAWAFGRFFRFFFGTLRQVYLPRVPLLDPFGDLGARGGK